jgi:hypothetical protein
MESGMEKNPYTILFGKLPRTVISREIQLDMIVEEFCEDEINNQAYVVVGVRGSGKTVFLTEAAKEISSRKDWIVIDLNAERNLLEDFVSALNSRKPLSKIFREAKINLSMLGFGLEIQDAAPITNIQEAARQMLLSLKKHGKRVLVTVDELRNSGPTREFALAFQSFIREELPIFFLSTGLYENVSDLQHEKGSTFFLRAPKIDMEPLGISDIADNYQGNFGLGREEAVRMARMTGGYSFAFQVLGYYTWKADGDFDGVRDKYRNYLFNYSYDMIWSEFSQMDREFAYGIARSVDGKTADIRQITGWGSDKIGPYRQRMKKRGLVNLTRYGYTTFILPLFDEFVISRYEMMMDV